MNSGGEYLRRNSAMKQSEIPGSGPSSTERSLWGKAALSLLLLACSLSSAAESENISVLIVDGYSNHDWRHTTECIKSILRSSGICDVDVSTSPPTGDAAGWSQWRPQFKQYDVVVQNTNSLVNGVPWPGKVMADFEHYVREGGGVFIFHSANNAFPEWEAYNRMIGLGWRKADQGYALEVTDQGKVVRIPPGEGKHTSHGPRRDILIHVLQDHPINRGYPKHWRTPDIEVYTYARGPAENMEVLSYAHDEQTGKNWPIEWVIDYGKGRVYNSTFGHIWQDARFPESIRCAGVQTTIIRAVQWLAGRTVSEEVPEDFPTENGVSLRPMDLEYSEQDGWKSLFNGKDLSGWKVACLPGDRDEAFWTVKDGAIVCDSIGKREHHYVWLITEDDYDDFELHLKFQVFRSSKGNSGVQFRSRYDNSSDARFGGWLNGPQIDVHPPMPFRTGLVYDETAAVNRWIHPSLENSRIIPEQAPKAALQTTLVYADTNPDAWNSLDLLCDGMKIETFVNNRRITDFDASGVLDDQTHRRHGVGANGQIALQLHSHDELLICFKDLYIRTLND